MRASCKADAGERKERRMAVGTRRAAGKWLAVSAMAALAAFGLWLWLSAAVLAKDIHTVEGGGEVVGSEHGETKMKAIPEQAAREKDAPPDGARLLVQVRGEWQLAEGVDLAGLDGVQLAAGQMFSLRSLMEKGAGDGWSHPASLLHEAAVKAGLAIAERHIGLGLADGVSPGFEAVVDGKSRDLKIYNGHDFDLWVQAGTDLAGIPFIRLVGDPPDGWRTPVISVETERFAPETMVVAIGHSSRTYEPAWTSRDGLLAKVFRTEGGNRELLYKDFYPALPKVEIR